MRALQALQASANHGETDRPDTHILVSAIHRVPRSAEVTFKKAAHSLNITDPEQYQVGG